MRILLIALASSMCACAAIVEVDDTFQLNVESDRERLLDYVEENGELDVSSAALTVLGDNVTAPTLVDVDGDFIEPATFSLPPREEIDADPADVLSAREPGTSDDQPNDETFTLAEATDGVERAD